MQHQHIWPVTHPGGGIYSARASPKWENAEERSPYVFVRVSAVALSNSFKTVIPGRSSSSCVFSCKGIISRCLASRAKAARKKVAHGVHLSDDFPSRYLPPVLFSVMVSRHPKALPLGEGVRKPLGYHSRCRPAAPSIEDVSKG